MTSSLPSPILSLLRLMAKSVLCVGLCTLDVSGPGRPRFGGLQTLSLLWSLNHCKQKLVSGRTEGLRWTVARGNLALAGPLPVC